MPPPPNIEHIFNRVLQFFADPPFVFIKEMLGAVRPISITASIVLFICLTYTVMRLSQIRRKEYEFFHSRAVEFMERKKQIPLHRNPKWGKVTEHISSESPADWRLAILEADIMLGEVLDILGSPGVNIGEKLKSIEKSDFASIDQAWEAHRIRNQIAHEGSAFNLTSREARRVVELYRQIFEEFRYI